MHSTASRPLPSTDLPGSIRPHTYWIDGQLVPAAQATLPLGDLAFTRGYAAFDAVRTYDGVPFMLDAHLRRLADTCEQMLLNMPRSPEEITRIVDATIAANGFPESLVRIFVTGGDATGFTPEHRERLLVLVDPLRTYPAWQYEKGIALATSPLGRPLPLAKSTVYLSGVWATMRARKAGYDEVVLVDAAGAILEGTTFSVVAVLGRELVSPAADVLHGITLHHVLDLARSEGLTVRREPLTPELLRQADELFITSSTREIIPVARVDDWDVPVSAGPLTRRLHERYIASAHQYAASNRGVRRAPRS